MRGHRPAADGAVLGACGCCAGTTVQTPALVYNRRGLSALAYRVGTHARFKHTLLARLSDARQPALARLTTRDDDDLSIALLDAWATVADVLTFYQERIANEAYLRTATERVSVLELARLIGYELRPGVAASTHLAFALEDPPGATRQTASALGTPRTTTIEAGVKVQSVPRPGQQAQTYETAEAIEARVDWNAMKPRLTFRHPIAADATTLFFAGFATGLRKGDGLLVFPDDGGKPVFRRVAAVSLNEAEQRTEARLEPRPAAVPKVTGAAVRAAPTSVGEIGAALAAGHVTSSAPATATIGAVKSALGGRSVASQDLQLVAFERRFNVEDLFEHLAASRPPPPSVLAFRTRAAVFGHNAPRWETLPVSQRVGEWGPSPLPDQPDRFAVLAGPYADRKPKWVDGHTLGDYPNDDVSAGMVPLDSVYPTIVADTWIVATEGTRASASQVSRVDEVSMSDFTLSAKLTRLTLDAEATTPAVRDDLSIRGTTIFGQSEDLPLARLPDESPVEKRQIDLERLVAGLLPGRKLIVCGELTDLPGVRQCEVVTIATVEQVFDAEPFTRLTLAEALVDRYVRKTVTINGNVALATHGETVLGIPGVNAEILGSGDATVPFQRFALREPPLTYVSAPTPSGGRSTLEIRVDGILWHEVDTLYGHAPAEHIYVTRRDDDGVTTVMFGDGVTGARLPSGENNVRARYRKGIGVAGLVDADQLSQLMTRSLGVQGATNPSASTGAADPERLAAARTNAPLQVLTLGRIVSLQDYEDFARAFSGIEKALATWAWNGEQRFVFVTVAGEDGADVPPDGTLYHNLLDAMRAAGDPAVPLEVRSYGALHFQIDAAVKIDPDHDEATVRGAVERALRSRFSFAARSLGQPVAVSEVIAVMQGVPGVEAVDVNALFRSDLEKPASVLRAAMPLPGDDEVVAAELLTLDPRPIQLGDMT